MRMKVPITGTITSIDPLQGDDNDRVRLIDINLGQVSWTMVGLDLEKGEMEIEVLPSDRMEEPTGELNSEGKPIMRQRPATVQERQGFLNHAKGLVEGKTNDELYIEHNAGKLKMSANAKQQLEIIKAKAAQERGV